MFYLFNKSRFIYSKVDKIVLITMAVIMNHGDCLRLVGH